MRFMTFRQAIAYVQDCLRDNSEVVHTERWQGVDVSRKPEAAMHEVRYLNFSVPVEHTDLVRHRFTIRPNLPWADAHFDERVCGAPLNPGIQWRHWPYAQSADKFREGERFNHSYMERMWPKYAHADGPPFETRDQFERYLDTLSGLKRSVGSENWPNEWPLNYGIKYRYGDLDDLVEQLNREPLTRQAYLPIWFPEDTGIANPDRKPCTLGYFFLMRNGKLDVTYYIRSCDFVRHFRDDIYLTVRLQIWILERLRALNPVIWNDVEPGLFRMDIGSLHCFRNDFIQLFPKKGA
jgi:hypothetical protein